MRVLSILSGKAIWLFETVELNPRGLDVHPIYAAIKSKYAFSTPKTRDEIEISKDGVKFQNGSFKLSESESLAVNLSVFNDGLVAETMAGTSSAEAFLGDLTNFIQKQHGLFFEDRMVLKRRYGSSLLIESESGLSRISEAISEISVQLSAETGRQYRASGLTIGLDPTEPVDGLGAFIIERRTSVPFASNRFFSSAPLRTDSHIAVLNRFETLMANEPSTNI